MYFTYQCCGFGSESAWTGIDFGRLDPDRNYVGKNDSHKKEKGEKMYCFYVLDVFFIAPKVSSVA
jgi:hypothetical protein